MTQVSHERLKALLLILMAMFLANLVVSGQIHFYIGPRFSWLLIVSVALLILIASSYRLVNHSQEKIESANEENQPDTRWFLPIAIVALPLILGTVIPAKPLGASAVVNRGMSTSLRIASSGSISRQSGNKTVLYWVETMNSNPDASALDGQSADVIGFVYHDPRLAENQFIVARFAITCCVADAMALGIVVESSDALELKSDSWVNVKGNFKSGTVNGQATPVLVADDILPVQQPEQPYLYP